MTVVPIFGTTLSISNFISTYFQPVISSLDHDVIDNLITNTVNTHNSLNKITIADCDNNDVLNNLDIKLGPGLDIIPPLFPK